MQSKIRTEFFFFSRDPQNQNQCVSTVFFYDSLYFGFRTY